MTESSGDIMSVTPEVTYTCTEPGCDRVFPSPNALQGHKIAHLPPQSCPECGKQYKTLGALGNHRKNEHGIEGTSKTAITSRKRTAAKRNGSEPMEVDDIFASVLHLLFPKGTVPVTAIVPLLQWREQTQDFLDKVQS